MFNIGMGELILILLVAFVVVGPQDLPKISRALARGLKQVRGLIREVKESIDLESEIQAVNETKDEVVNTLKEYNPLDKAEKELSDVKKEFREAGDALKADEKDKSLHK